MACEVYAMRVGLLTFHHVYNYGAVLQAYSLQKVLDEELGIVNEIIDFSTKKQRDWLDLYSVRNGFKRFVKTLCLFPYHFGRKRRKSRFEEFIKNNMRLSVNTYYRETDLKETNRLYDIFISGSDQTWNVTKKADTSDAYFLSFADESKIKISYAASIGNATYEQLLEKKHFLERYHYISCREPAGANIIQRITNREVSVDLDPTLLVDIKYLQKFITPDCHKPYLLFYSLDGYRQRNNNCEILSILSQKFGLMVLYITPEWPKHPNGQEIIDAGPKEFLSLIANAELICTNSFHGTALSIKMEKPFYVLEKKNISDNRKRSILQQLDLSDRIISSVQEAENVYDYNIDYGNVNVILEKHRRESLDYLKKALEFS